jgi:hypothetical protein
MSSGSLLSGWNTSVLLILRYVSPGSFLMMRPYRSCLKHLCVMVNLLSC